MLVVRKLFAEKECEDLLAVRKTTTKKKETRDKEKKKRITNERAEKQKRSRSEVIRSSNEGARAEEKSSEAKPYIHLSPLSFSISFRSRLGTSRSIGSTHQSIAIVRAWFVSQIHLRVSFGIACDLYSKGKE